MTIRQRRRFRRRPFRTALILLAVAGVALAAPLAATAADTYVPISGAGSTWAFNAVDAWRVDVGQYGMRINYAGTGSSDGRRQFLNGTTDFAVSDIPFQFNPEDGSPPENPASGSYAYMPIVAGGTVFMYNLSINGQRVTNLRMSGANIAKVFTGALTSWDDPVLAADNPGLTLPKQKIVPVVRSDGSGSTAQFSLWLIAQQGQLWRDYCGRVGRAGACGETSYYPTLPGMIAKFGDLGVAGYVSQSYAEGSIGYVNYSYALNAGFPVVKMLNAAGYYTEPTPDNVAVSLVKAVINKDPKPELYLTQDLRGVYSDTDPRVYPLSSYSYFILPTKVQGQFSEDKGKTLGAFSYYFMCQGQQEAPSLGYSPLPVNLVKAGLEQVAKVPGVNKQSISVAGCNNPTFSPDGHNSLVDRAPFPQDCDKQGAVQCGTGSGGAKQTTPTKAPVAPTAAAPQQTQPQHTRPAGGQQTTQAGQGPTTQRQPNAGGNPTTSSPAAGVGTTARTVVRTTPAGQHPSGPTRTTARGAKPNVKITARSAPAVAATSAAPSCDADTGVCSGAAGAQTTDAGTGSGGDSGGVTVLAQSVPLAGTTGWGPTQTLMVVAGLCALLLILLPPIVARQLNRKRTSP